MPKLELLRGDEKTDVDIRIDGANIRAWMSGMDSLAFHSK